MALLIYVRLNLAFRKRSREPQIFSTLNINNTFWLVNLVTINILKYNKVQIYN